MNLYAGALLRAAQTLQEQAMTNQSSKSQPWTKPEINRLGTLRDVGKQGPGTPQGGDKS